MCVLVIGILALSIFFFFKQKTAYEMRISDWSSDVCSSDLVEALLASGALVVDACRHVVRCGDAVVPLGTRPVLFALARALARAWPSDVTRATLLERAFRAKFADESHRARLRVEIGRAHV